MQRAALLAIAWCVLFGQALAVPVAARDAAAQGAADADRRSRLDAALNARGLRGAKIAAYVVDAADGRELYARDADRGLVPASNMKVLTALAALRAWGPSHQFTTTVLADREPGAAGSVGTLYVRGGGDPVLTSEQLWRLAADLWGQGLRRIDADIVLDDTAFDTVRWHPSWGAVSARAYHAPLSALSANYGAFETWVEPGSAPGAPVRVTTDPPLPYLRVVNRARTVGRGAALRYQVEPRSGLAHEEVRVTGSLPAGAPRQRVLRRVSDPTRFAGAVLRMQLEAVGIEIGGEVRVAPTPAEAVQLRAFQGLPLSEILNRFMKWSQNGVGEALVKGLALERGARVGTWPAGTAAARAQLEGLGLSLGSLTMLDGSGLSYDNRASPRLLVAALRAAQANFGVGPEFFASLPIAGLDGTLRRRARAATGRVRAKTGLLTRVTALTGVAEGPEGERLLFSVLVNGFRGGARDAMNALDAFASALTK
ncbi:MAG: D-alanyl-D-alanine carboxypeptidase/D-alanyl-D-alanine-endopeptidase [Myxococcales bacterium]|nr:D-alanyl-D-alanine carboxypeptidase/D-alanyl-D-alanine-endopeptidase [Myxococcales bacterium]